MRISLSFAHATTGRREMPRHVPSMYMTARRRLDEEQFLQIMLSRSFSLRINEPSYPQMLQRIGAEGLSIRSRRGKCQSIRNLADIFKKISPDCRRLTAARPVYLLKRLRTTFFFGTLSDVFLQPLSPYSTFNAGRRRSLHSPSRSIIQE